MSRIFITVLLVAIPTIGEARGYQQLRADWRELCRQQIAGTYLVKLDRYRLTKDHLARAQSQKEKTRVYLASAKTSLESLEQHLTHNPYNAELAERLDEARTRVRVLDTQKSHYQALATQSKQSLALAKRAYQNYSKKIQATFVIRQDPSLSDRGYPIEIKYRSDCPEFRSVCPLSNQEKVLLEAIFTPEEPPEACRKYLNIN